MLFQPRVMLEGMQERSLDDTPFPCCVQSSADTVQYFACIAKKFRCSGSFTCMYKHLCAGQVPLTDAEAQALKESRQTSASQDWLMGAESIEHETTACQDSGESLLTVCNTMFSQAASGPEPHLMAASPDMLCCVSQLFAF